LILKIILIFFGTIFLSLGVIGIIIPGLPATPFFLLAAAFYIRSSNKLYNWLKNHKFFGKYIDVSKGISSKLKIFLIAIMWIMIFITILFVFDEMLWKIILVGIGIIGTVIKILLPTKQN